jgi:hypothetical protein
MVRLGNGPSDYKEMGKFMICGAKLASQGQNPCSLFIVFINKFCFPYLVLKSYT